MRRLGGLLLATVIIFGACKKEFVIDPTYPQEMPIIIEGNIATGKPPVVTLSLPNPAFDTVKPEDIKFVHNATVIAIRENTDTIILVEYNKDTLSGLLWQLFNSMLAIHFTGIETPLYFYSVPRDKIITGKSGEQWQFVIYIKSKIYSTTVKIPNTPYPLENITPVPQKGRYYMVAEFIDPPGTEDYGIYYTKYWNVPFCMGRYWSDRTIDGKRWAWQITPGSCADRAHETAPELFYSEDRVEIAWCRLDRESYDYLKELDNADDALDNPFDYPTLPTGNMSTPTSIGHIFALNCQYHKFDLP